MMKRFLAVLVARNREFLRDRSSLVWNILLPVLLIFGFAFMFSGEQRDLFKVGVYGQSVQPEQMEKLKADYPIFNVRYIHFFPVADLSAALVKVEHHQIDMLFSLVPGEQAKYWLNASSQNGYLLEQLLQRNGVSLLQRQEVTGREIRYVDWLIPGVLGMNMMFSALFGVGYVIVRYRKNGMLRRLSATPLSAFEFLSAQVVSRLWLILTISTLVYIGCDLFVDFIMLGSYLNLLLIFTLGSMCMISLGLLMASRVSSEELAGGLLNMLTWPMMILSGVWFSLEGASEWVQMLAQIFPLTHVVDAARAIMTDGAGFTDVSNHYAVLLAMTLAFMGLGSYLFRWESK